MRRRLVPRVTLDGGTARRYQVPAPIEWNFHPDGPLARGLLGAPAGDAARRSALLVTAFDPCDAWDLVIEGAGGGNAHA